MNAHSIEQLLRGKRFGLVMSAGFFGFYGHTGFVKALFERGLQPSAYAGTSAGGLIAAHLAAGSSVDEVEAMLRQQTRKHFSDPDPLGALVDVVRGGHRFTGLLKGERFRGLIDASLPVKTFEQCPKPLLLVATNLRRARSEIFDHGELSPAVHATCAYPGLFRAVRHEGSLYWDGGIVDKAPVLALAESNVGQKLEAFLVHYLPSRTRDRLGGALAWAQGMDAGLSAGRREHFELQLKVLQARGIPVYVIVSKLPEVSPRTMQSAGAEAMAAAHASVRRALDTAPVEFEA